MTIGNALAFIERALKDHSLRARLNAATRSRQRDRVLEDENLLFSAHDFDEAVFLRLTRCRESEAADQIKELKMWWDLLSQCLEPAACEKSCSGCGE